MNYIFAQKHIYPLLRKYIFCFLLLLLSFAGVTNNARAATYNLTSGQYPPCSTSSWTVSGTTYTCNGNGRVTLANGDILTASTTIKIVAANGFTLNNNTIGSTSANISLTSTYGTFTSSNTNTVYGSITSDSGSITLVNTTVSGTISTSAAISLTGGSVTGLVTSTSNGLTTSNTNLSGGAKANSSMSITGGTLAGAFVMTATNAASFSNITMSSGSISGASTVSVTNSTLGLSSSYIPISSVSGAITLQSSSVYGNMTAPSYSTVNVTSSSVYGSCSPGSTPANACISSSPVCTTGLVGGLTGNYFTNTSLTGTSSNRIDTSVDFDWGTGAPGVTGIGVDNFSVRWVGSIRAPTTGNYKFQTISDDGVRLWINNQLVINDWNGHAATTNTTATIAMVSGQSYPVVLEYFEGGGSAVVRFNWILPGSTSPLVIGTQTGVTPDTSASCTVPPQNCTSGLMGGAQGKYYNNTTLTGSPAATRIDSTIDFNWDTGAPGVTGIGTDNFSVRWDGNLNVSTTGSYIFDTVSDDGVRLWINNQLVIDDWNSHSATTNTTSAINLTAGVNYAVRLEYFEGGGTSIIQFHWKTPGNSTFVPVNGCPATLSYYGISHSGTGITCAASPVTITALDGFGNAVAPVAGTQITLSTTPNTGTWYQGNTYTFAGTETSVVKYLQQLTGGSININVTDGTASESASLDPSITFASTALLFYGDSATASLPNQVAGTTNTTPTLKALRTDTNTGACVARVTGSKTVKMGYVCMNPSTCIAGQTLTVNGTSIQSNPAANLSSPTYSSFSLTFDSDGSASIPLNYSDVGQIRLLAQLALTASGSDPAVTISGSSNDFVVKPYTLAVSAVQSSTGAANPGGTSTAGTAAGFVSAGTPFQVNVEARNSAGNRTPNFGKESASENNILLSDLTVIYPAGGTATTLTDASSFSVASPAGTFSSSTVAWKQVGSFTVRPRLADNNYLGAGDITPTTSATIGRIYPDHFALTSSTLANACGVFTYMEQPTPLSYRLEAQSAGASGVILSNYKSGYADPVVSPTGVVTPMRAYPTYTAESNDSGNVATFIPPSPVTSRISINVSPDWSNGALDVLAAPFILKRQASTAPDGPYPAFQLGIDTVDNFDGRSLVTKNMNSSTSTNCSLLNNCTAVALGPQLNFLYGRMRLDDAFGPETMPLPVNFVTEYWTSTRFIQNTNDACTLLPRSAITYPAGTLANDANRSVNLGGGTTVGTYANLDATGVRFSNGSAGPHSFSAPGVQGSFVVGIDLTNFAWLRFDWNQDANYSDVKLPNATYSFGSYRGNDRIIYWRERLQ